MPKHRYQSSVSSDLRNWLEVRRVSFWLCVVSLLVLCSEPLLSRGFVVVVLAVVGLSCCMQAFSRCSEPGLLSSCSVWASRCGGFSSCGASALERKLNSCGTRAMFPCSMWYFPRPGIEPVSPALAGRFLTTRQPGKSQFLCFEVREKGMGTLSGFSFCSLSDSGAKFLGGVERWDLEKMNRNE